MLDSEGMVIVHVEVLGNGYAELLELLQGMDEDGWHVEWWAEEA